MGPRLLESEPGGAMTVNEHGKSPILLVCEHAGKVIPAKLGTLGLDSADLERHIAWDIGAESVSRRLSVLLDAPLILQRYSRLVYDCNRPPESPGAMPEMSETTAIPGNQALAAEARAQRVAEIYEPFHRRVAEQAATMMGRGTVPAIVTIHSFTPVYNGVRRYLDFGVLYDRDTRLADAVVTGAAAWRDVITRRNEPYGPADGVCHTLNMHTRAGERLGVMLEIRNDLIADEAGQAAWAARLAPLLEDAVTRAGGAQQWDILARSA